MMRMKKFIAKKKDNFKVWSSYEKMTKLKGIIVAFINNGILDDEASKSLLKSLYKEYALSCNTFYANLNLIYGDYVEAIGPVKIDFDINWKLRLYKMEAKDEEFDLQVFARNNLDLSEDALQMLLEAIDLI
jgi:hypothetical protein